MKKERKSITIKENSKSINIIKKSKFISFSYFIKTKKEALDIIEKHNEKYNDATHNCYGYIIKKNLEEGFSDDGEPAKTAGFPIIEYLKNNNYEYTLVIVTRYFGGTLLGTGGLTSAYKEGAKSVLEISGKSLVGDGFLVEFTSEYGQAEKIKNILNVKGINIKDIKYEEKVSFKVEIFEDQLNILEKELAEIFKVDIKNLNFKKEEVLVRR